MEVNTVVVSRKGHDTGRIYIVSAVLGPEFVLLVDGKYRKRDNPKMKRVKHLKPLGTSDALTTAKTDTELYKALQKFGF